MIWLLITFIAGLAVGVGYFMFTRQRPAQARPAQARPATATTPATGVRPAPSDKRYWGKQFICLDPAKACPEARDMHGRCFVYGKAPPVPLTGCASAGCTCHYRDIDERRTGKERRSGKERRDQVRFEEVKERRTGKDRRGDHYDWHFNA